MPGPPPITDPGTRPEVLPPTEIPPVSPPPIVDPPITSPIA